MKQLLNTKVEDLTLSVRLTNSLRSNGYYKLSDIVVMNKHDFLKHKGFGGKTLKELSELIEALELSFEMKIN